MKFNSNKALTFLKRNYNPLSSIQNHEFEKYIDVYRLEIGDSLSVSGKTQSSYLFLIKGSVELQASSKPSTILKSSDITNQPITVKYQRTSFTARSKSILIRIDLKHLDFLLAWSEIKKSPLFDKPSQHWLDSIKEPLIFRNIPLENISKIYDRFDGISAKKGENIVTQGEKGDFFYFIESGKAEVWQQGLDDDEQRKVATLSAMDHFGEDALIMDGYRNATVKMITDGTLKRLSKKSFNELINQPMEHQVSSHIAKIMIEKEKSLFLDVRYEEEYELEQIENSIFIPLHELRSRVQELDKNKKYIVYCHAGPRSTVAAHILNQRGFTASSLIGGIRDWPYDILSNE